MKIAIISDTHDRLSSLNGLFYHLEKQGINTVFHAGDVVFPPFFKEFFEKKITVYCTKGNNDGETEYLKMQLESHNSHFYSEIMNIEFSGKRILMKHKPDLVKSLAKSGDFDIIIYGHTHKPDIYEESGTIVINPGSLSGYLTDKRTFVLLDLDTGKAEIIEISGT